MTRRLPGVGFSWSLPVLAGVGAVQALGYAATLGWNLILARSIPLTVYGEFTFAFTCATLLALVVGGGAGQAWVRFFSGGGAPDSHRRFLYILAFTLCAGAIIGFVSVSGISEAGYFKLPASLGRLELLQICALATSMAVPMLTSSVLQARRQPVRAVSVNPAAAPVVLCLLFIFPVNQQSADITHVLGLSIWAYAVPSLIGVALVLIRRPQSAKSINGSAIVSPWCQVAFGLQAASISLVYVGITNLDRIMLGLLAPIDEVGVYGLAARFSAILYAAVYVMPPIVGPIFARHLERDPQRARDAYDASSYLIAACTFPVALSLVFWGRDIVGLSADPAYASGHIIVAILSAGCFLAAATGNNGLMLQMGGRQTLELSMSLVVLGLNFVGNIMLIPVFGGLGAAIATAASLLLSTILKTYVCYRNWGFLPAVLRNSELWIASLVYVTVGWGLHSMAGIVLPIALVCALGAYVWIVHPRRVVSSIHRLGVD